MILGLLMQHPIAAIVIFGVIVMAIAIHEAAHAYSAHWLGDDTPKLQGRLTLNPLKHLDPWGTLLIVIVGIGWGKPVQFNPYNLKNPRRDTAIIAFAGPLSNLIMATIAAMLLRILGIASADIVFLILQYLVWLNVALAIFNLLPIDPLDGYKIVAGILPPGLAYQWEETKKFGMVILILLLISGVVGRIVSPAVTIISSVLLGGPSSFSL